MKWITRERPKIDRIACPWLILRYIDPLAEFLYVPAHQVREIAVTEGATPFDVPDVEFTHLGDRCSFDTFLLKYNLNDPALRRLADIVRGADTDHHDLAPECAGLLAISLGLGIRFTDDHELLRQGLIVYDALYAYCQQAYGQTHDWIPDALRVTQV